MASTFPPSVTIPTPPPTTSPIARTVMNSTMPWEVNPQVLNFLGVVGSGIVMLLWMSPMKDVWTGKGSIFATKSTAHLATGFPYVASLYNCVLWSMYGATRWDQLLISNLCNALGIILNGSFAACYYTYAMGEARQTIAREVVVFLPSVALAAFTWMWSHSTDGIGYIAAVLNTLMYFAPLRGFKILIRDRSTASIPFPPLVLTLLSSIIWFLYGLYLINVPFMLPNAFGMVFGIVQLSLFAWARRHERRVAARIEVEDEEDNVVVSGPGALQRSTSDAFLDDAENGIVTDPIGMDEAHNFLGEIGIQPQDDARRDDPHDGGGDDDDDDLVIGGDVPKKSLSRT